MKFPPAKRPLLSNVTVTFDEPATAVNCGNVPAFVTVLAAFDNAVIVKLLLSITDVTW